MERKTEDLGNGKKRKVIITWDSFQEKYQESKKKRDLYILKYGEDYILNQKEGEFFKKSIQKNGYVEGIKKYRNRYGEGDKEVIKSEYKPGERLEDAKKRIKKEEMLYKILDPITEKGATWPSN